MSTGFNRAPEGAGPTSSVESGVLKESRSFVWKITDFNLVRKSEALIRAQSFEFEAGRSIGVPTTCLFYLSPFTDKNDGNKKWIGAYFKLLKKHNAGLKEVNVSFTIKVRKENGVTGVYCREVFKDMLEGNGWGAPKVAPCVGEVKDLPLIDGSLIFEIDFSLFGPKPRTKLNLDLVDKMAEFNSTSITQLATDLGKTDVLSGANADSVTKIISKDKVEFPVNRGILSARCEVFQRMFESGMKEAQTGRVQINDLSSKTVKVLLGYLCTGQLHEEWKCDEVIEELTHAAHKYELALLTSFLDDVLGSVCNIGNANKLMFVAKKLDMKKAENDLFTYIKANATSPDDLSLVLENEGPPPKRRKRN